MHGLLVLTVSYPYYVAGNIRMSSMIRVLHKKILYYFRTKLIIISPEIFPSQTPRKGSCLSHKNPKTLQSKDSFSSSYGRTRESVSSLKVRERETES